MTDPYGTVSQPGTESFIPPASRLKQNRSGAQSESASQLPAHSGKRQLGLSPKKFKTPVHGTDVVHSGNDGAADNDGMDE